VEDFNRIFRLAGREEGVGDSWDLRKRAEEALQFEKHGFTVKKIQAKIECAKEEVVVTESDYILKLFDDDYDEAAQAELEAEGVLDTVRERYLKNEIDERAKSYVARDVLIAIAEGIAA
jgi:hypothetical protein